MNDVADLEKKKLLKAITKSLIVPLALLFYIFKAAQIDALIIIGLIFGWFGDVFLLEKQEKKRFVMGLGSFLLGHVIYIIGFLIKVDFSRAFNSALLGLLIIYIVCVGLLFLKLNDYLGDFRLPVIIYSSTLVLMSLSSFMLASSPNIRFVGNGVVVFVGSIFFLISDSILAYAYFRNKFKYHNSIVMLTYILAQFFIVLGFAL